MLSRRSAILTALILAPVLVYLGLGGYALWTTGLFTRTFWILPACWLGTWLLSLIWKAPARPPQLDEPYPRHFTPRDRSALEIVERYQQQVDEVTAEQMTDPHFYVRTVQELAQDLARHYHPRATDPVSSLTIPEVLAAVRLAVDDMERWMLEAVPGSRLVTIKQWKWLQHAPRWMRRAQNAVWAAGILLNPANVVKYLASQVTVGPLSDELQAEFLAAVYLRFIRQTGFYLIEMNSGRLSGGADRYRQAFAPERHSAPAPGGAGQTPLPESLTVALVGQVKAGKSSLVNALLEEQTAVSDVLPATRSVGRYRCPVPDSTTEVVLLDTPGYAESGATRSQREEILEAIRSADVVVLVLDAHAPAREADRKLMDELKEWYAPQAQLQVPPLLICLTHVDLLSPMMEWSPPYDWRNPSGPKARSLHDAVEEVQGLFADMAVDVVPVCADIARGRSWGVREELLPALAHLISDGQTVALLKAYHRDLERGRLKELVSQLKVAGGSLLRMWIDQQLRPPARNS